MEDFDAARYIVVSLMLLAAGLITGYVVGRWRAQEDYDERVRALDKHYNEQVERFKARGREIHQELEAAIRRTAMIEVGRGDEVVFQSDATYDIGEDR